MNSDRFARRGAASTVLFHSWPTHPRCFPEGRLARTCLYTCAVLPADRRDMVLIHAKEVPDFNVLRISRRWAAGLRARARRLRAGENPRLGGRSDFHREEASPPAVVDAARRPRSTAAVCRLPAAGASQVRDHHSTAAACPPAGAFRLVAEAADRDHHSIAVVFPPAAEDAGLACHSTEEVCRLSLRSSWEAGHRGEAAAEPDCRPTAEACRRAVEGARRNAPPAQYPRADPAHPGSGSDSEWSDQAFADARRRLPERSPAARRQRWSAVRRYP